MTEENNKKNRAVLGLKVPQNKQNEGDIVAAQVVNDSRRGVIWGKRGSVVIITKGRGQVNDVTTDGSKNSLTIDERKRRFNALESAQREKVENIINDQDIEENCSEGGDGSARCNVNDSSNKEDLFIAKHSSKNLDSQNELSGENIEEGSVINENFTKIEENIAMSQITPQSKEAGMISDMVDKYDDNNGKALKTMSFAELKKQGKLRNLDISFKANKIQDPNKVGTIQEETTEPSIAENNSISIANKKNDNNNYEKCKKYGFDSASNVNEEESGSKKKEIGIKKSEKIKSNTNKNMLYKFNPAQLVRFEMESESNSDDEVEILVARGRGSSAHKKHKKSISKQSAPAEKIMRNVTIPDFITVQELALRSSEKAAVIIKELMKLGIVASINKTIDADTAELIIRELGHTPKRYTEEDYVKELLNNGENIAEKEEDMQFRAPIVTIMGHVDHGKTSLLDALRSTNVVSRESGGITQHIGAYKVKTLNGKEIVFLDTPGHEAFTAMRIRGAKVTDIVVLVVAADDGVKAQTIEAINHAKVAGVQIIVAINKIDKPGADIVAIKNELLSHELVPEDMGGDIMVVPISAQQKIGFDQLEDAILLSADFMELKANPNRPASGNVIEARIDKGRGAIVTLLVQNGTLYCGDLVVAGLFYGKVRAMRDDRGHSINQAGPSTPVEVVGLSNAPVAGDEFIVLRSERVAKELTDFRLQQEKARKNAVAVKKFCINQLFIDTQSGVKELAIVVKADVQGSVEAIVQSLSKFVNNEVRARVVHYAVGSINESDITLAITARAIVLGFNVRANSNAKMAAQTFSVDVRYYSVIYDLLGDIRKLMGGMLSPLSKEKIVGYIAVKKVFDLSKYGKIAGCYVTEGFVKRSAHIRILRDNIVIHTGKIKSLKRQKDDVKEVKAGFECGISLESFNDILERDTFEVFEVTEEAREFEVVINPNQSTEKKDNNDL